MTLHVPFTFNTATFGGQKNVYVNAFDNTGAVTHWINTGTFTVQ